MSPTLSGHLSPTATALMSTGKTLICFCHSPPRCSEWIPGRKKFFEMLEYHNGSNAKAGVITAEHQECQVRCDKHERYTRTY